MAIYTGADGFRYSYDEDQSSLSITEFPGTYGTLTNITAINRGKLTLQDQTIVDLSFVTDVYITTPTTEHLYTLGDYAFRDCTSLNLVNLDGVDTLGVGVFLGCTSLHQVSSADHITHVPNLAFYGCTALNRIVMLAVISVGISAFENTNIDMLPSRNIIFIDSSAFAHNPTLTGVGFSKSLTSIGEDAFLGCYNVKEIRFEGSKPQIGSGALSFGLQTHPATVDVTDTAGGWTFGELDVYSDQYTTFRYNTDPVQPIDESYPIEFVSNVNIHGNLQIYNGEIRADGLSLPRKVTEQKLLTSIYGDTITIQHNLGEAPSSVLLFLVTVTLSEKIYTQILADVTSTDDDITIRFTNTPSYGSKLLIKALI